MTTFKSKDDESIEYLYKYRSLDGKNKEYVKRTFLNNEVYLSVPDDFNDPFEARPQYSFKASTLAKEKYFKGVAQRNFPDKCADKKKLKQFIKNGFARTSKIRDDLINGFTKELTTQAGIYSMTEDHKNLLMWSHYANSHKGICLKFRATSYTKFFGESLQVNYQHEYPKINFIKHSSNEKLQLSLLTKSKEWAYEKEWRMLKPEEGRQIHLFPPEHLVGVILGCKIDPNDRSDIIAWIKESKKSITVQQAKLDKASFAIQMVDVEI